MDTCIKAQCNPLEEYPIKCPRWKLQVCTGFHQCGNRLQELEAKKRVKKKDKKKKKAGDRKAEADASEATSDAGADGPDGTPDAVAKDVQQDADGASGSSHQGESPPTTQPSQLLTTGAFTPERSCLDANGKVEDSQKGAVAGDRHAVIKSPVHHRASKPSEREEDQGAGRTLKPHVASKAFPSAQKRVSADSLDSKAVGTLALASMSDSAGQSHEVKATAPSQPVRSKAAPSKATPLPVSEVNSRLQTRQDATRERHMRGGGRQPKALRTPPRAHGPSAVAATKASQLMSRGGEGSNARAQTIPEQVEANGSGEGRKGRQRRQCDRQRDMTGPSEPAPTKSTPLLAPQRQPLRSTGRGMGAPAVPTAEPASQISGQQGELRGRPTAAGLSFAAVARGQLRSTTVGTAMAASTSKKGSENMTSAAALRLPGLSTIAQGADIDSRSHDARAALPGPLGTQRQLVFTPATQAARAPLPSSVQPSPLPVNSAASSQATLTEPLQNKQTSAVPYPGTAQACAEIAVIAAYPSAPLDEQLMSEQSLSMPIAVPAPQQALSVAPSLPAVSNTPPYPTSRQQPLSATAPAWPGPPRPSLTSGLPGSSPGAQEPRSQPGLQPQRADFRVQQTSGEASPVTPSSLQHPGAIAVGPRPAAWRAVDAVDWSFGGTGRGSPFSRTGSATSLSGLAPRRALVEMPHPGEPLPGVARSSLGSDSGTSEWSLSLACDGAVSTCTTLQPPPPDAARRSFGSDGPSAAAGTPGFASLLQSIWRNGPAPRIAAPVAAGGADHLTRSTNSPLNPSGTPAKPVHSVDMRAHTVRLCLLGLLPCMI